MRKRWGDIKPWLGAILLFAASIDWFIIPILLFGFEFSVWITWLISAPMANIEVRLWYKFWWWFIYTWMPQKKKMRWIGNYFHGRFVKASSPDSRASQIIKGFGHAGMIVVGAEPFIPLGRVVAVIFCVSTKWKDGLYSLYVGNTIHVFISILQWKAGISLLAYIWQ